MGSGGASKTTRSKRAVVVTIANGAALSSAIDMRESAGGIVEMPAAWTTADLGIQVSADGVTYAPLADAFNAYGSDVSIDGAAASTAYPLPPFVFSAQYIKLWSHNGTGTGVNQDAERTLKVHLSS